MSKSDGFRGADIGPEFVSPVELARRHVHVREYALSHMVSVLEARLRKEQEGQSSYAMELPLEWSTHPIWACKAELQNLRGVMESAGWDVHDLKIENNVSAWWLHATLRLPRPLVTGQGPYR
jgi:hypothetical protein